MRTAQKVLKCILNGLEMPLISCEINLDLNLLENCIIVATNANQNRAFSITDTKFYVPVLTLLIQDNVRVQAQL